MLVRKRVTSTIMFGDILWYMLLREEIARYPVVYMKLEDGILYLCIALYLWNCIIPNKSDCFFYSLSTSAKDKPLT